MAAARRRCCACSRASCWPPPAPRGWGVGGGWQGEGALAYLPAHGRRTSFLGHQDAVKPGLTVTENLSLGGSTGAEAQAEALEAMDLADLADLPARFLSAGQKRRLAIA